MGKIFRKLGPKSRLTGRGGSSKGKNASVMDFASEADLMVALGGQKVARHKPATGGTGGTGGDKPWNKPTRTSRSSRSADDDSKSISEDTFDARTFATLDTDDDSLTSEESDTKKKSKKTEVEKVEWELVKYDKDETVPNTMEQELERLAVLQSYLLLDAPGVDQEFDRITKLTKRIFKSKMSMISLVDLGRQWFLAPQGTDDKETPRKVAFCNHVVQSKKNMMIVLDATKDERFKDNPLVTEHPGVRFYAGAALMSPEGYKIGVMCTVDTKPRKTFTKEDMEILQDMAAMAMSAMVERRRRLENHEGERTKQLAQTCNDLVMGLEMTQEVLEQFCEQEYAASSGISEEQVATIATAAESIDVIARMGRSAMRSAVAAGTDPEDPKKARGKASKDDASSSGRSKKSRSSRHGGEEEKQNGSGGDPIMNLMVEFENTSEKATKMMELFDNINKVIDPQPKTVPVTIRLHKKVPMKVLADDLLLFRSVLNLVAHSMDRSKMKHTTKKSSSKDAANEGGIHLFIRINSNHDKLVFECEDAGPEVPKDEMKTMFKTRSKKKWDGEATNEPPALLQSAASMVKSMGGSTGVRPGATATWYTMFWFTVPLLVAYDDDGKSQDAVPPTVGKSLLKRHEPKTVSSIATKSKTGNKADSQFFASVMKGGGGGFCNTGGCFTTDMLKEAAKQ